MTDTFPSANLNSDVPGDHTRLKQRVRAAAIRFVRESLPSISVGIGLVLSLTVMHDLLAATDPGRLLRICLNLVLTTLWIGLASPAGRGTIARCHPYPLVAGFGSLLLANALFSLHHTGDILYLSMFSVGIIGTGVIFLSRPWLLSTLGVINLATILTAVLAAIPVNLNSLIWVLAAATILAVFLNRMLFRTMIRLERLRIDDEHHQAELVGAMRTLQQKETQFRMLSESVPIGVFQTDLEGRCTYTNTAFRQITGFSLERTLNCRWYEGIVEDDRNRVIEVWQDRMRGDESFEEVIRYVTPEGVRWLHLRTNPVFSDDGAVHVGAIEDITERRRHEEKLREAAITEKRQSERLRGLVAQLDEARRKAELGARSKSEFLANMSHEIRTPMTAILGYADVLLDEEDTPDSARSHLQTIRRNGNYLLEIINDILDLSKIEAGRLEMERVSFAPRQVIEDVAELMGIRAREKNLELRVEMDDNLPAAVQSDPTRVRQIIINLVGNALKFTTSGSVTIHASGESLTDGRFRLDLTVIDTGIGMDEETVSRLFQPFSQADNSTSRRYGGTGLGLTITRRLARMLGGDIEVHSERGRGSQFAVHLNVHVCELSELKQAGPSTSTVVSPENVTMCPLSGRPRLLLAEDGPDNQKLLSFILKKSGYDVDIVENGQLACDAILNPADDAAGYQLVLMDMSMPLMDGYEATRLLRNNGVRLPIVALTAHAMTGDREKCMDAGCSDFLTKPVDKKILLDKIASFLGTSDANASSVTAESAEQIPVNSA